MSVETGISTSPNVNGVSLLELIPHAEKQYGGHGPRISPRVMWLSNEIEEPEFWKSLNAHMAEDERKRHSVGGIFTGPSGEKALGPYTWSQVFCSLDSFLKGFDERAVEFLFRDFKPALGNKETTLLIESTRTLALDKYPRLRRIFWDDYRSSLESPLFWRGLVKDLERLKEPATPSSFFYKEVELKGNSEIRLLPTYLQALSVLDSTKKRGVPGKKAQFLSYPNLAQIIRDTFRQNPREFLLNYNPQSKNTRLQEEVAQAKSMLFEKILPPQPKPEHLEIISVDDLAKTIRTPAFWFKFVQDLDNHIYSSNQAYSLHYFLRTYDREANNIIDNNSGDYASLTTAFLGRKRKGPLLRQLIKPSKELTELLMWKFQPQDEISELVLDAKRICSELFQQDCLFVALQIPEFWEEISQDIDTVEGNPSFKAFLRFFSQQNPEADGRKHKKGTSRYQRYLQRAYHKPEEFKKLTQMVGVELGADYSETLNNFFYHFAPPSVQEKLRGKFPADFTDEGRLSKLKDLELLQQIKDFIGSLIEDHPTAGIIKCESLDEVEKIRNKLNSASRSLNVHLSSSLNGTTLSIKIAKRKKFNSKEITALEPKIKELREQGLQNKDIARAMGFEDYYIEYIAGKLIKRGEIERRRNSTKKRL